VQFVTVENDEVFVPCTEAERYRASGVLSRYCGDRMRWDSEHSGLWVVPERDCAAPFDKALGNLERDDDYMHWFIYQVEPRPREISSTIAGALRPAQTQAVEWAMRSLRMHEGIFILDDIGLGKSLESLAILDTFSAYPAVVVCPSSLKYNWQAEIGKRLPSLRVAILEGRRNRELPKAEVLVVNYEILADNLRLLLSRKHYGVIFDEFHNVRNMKTKKARAALKLANESPYRMGLTGTPVVNRPAELWAQLYILNRHWCEREEYFNAYCGPTQISRYDSRFGVRYVTVYNGATNLDDLRERIKPFSIRRLKSEVMKDLKEPQISLLPVEISNLKDYRDAENELTEYLHSLDGEEIELPDPLKLEGEKLARVTKLRKIVAEGKIAPLLEWIDNFLESGHKLVVFAHHRALQEAIFSHVPNAARISGGDTAERKDQAKRKFIEDSECKLIVCSLKGAQAGLDGMQQVCSHVLLAESDWTPSGNDQAIGRIARSGQTEQPNVWIAVARGTIDVRVARIVDEKRLTINQVTGDDERGVREALLSELLEA
jgi:SNF2 family DNA or RNA helicase